MPDNPAAARRKVLAKAFRQPDTKVSIGKAEWKQAAAALAVDGMLRVRADEGRLIIKLTRSGFDEARKIVEQKHTRRCAAWESHFAEVGSGLGQ